MGLLTTLKQINNYENKIKIPNLFPSPQMPNSLCKKHGFSNISF